MGFDSMEIKPVIFKIHEREPAGKIRYLFS